MVGPTFRTVTPLLVITDSPAFFCKILATVSERRIVNLFSLALSPPPSSVGLLVDRRFWPYSIL